MNDKSPLHIGFIFEGPTDQETIPVLVAKLLQRPIEVTPIEKEAPGFDDFKRPSPEDLRLRRHGPKWGMFKSYVIALLIEGVDAIVVVVDNDCDDPPYKRWCLLARNLPSDERPIRLIDVSDLAKYCKDIHLALGILEEHLSKAYQEDTIPVIIGVAVQMLEAWLLARPHVVESVLWDPLAPVERTRCIEPEQIRHPKNEIIHRHNGGSDLSQEQARQIGIHPDFTPGPIETACPSFARFAADIHILVDFPETE
jgi:hypothetical protein